MTQTVSWNDNAFWRLTIRESDLPEFTPFSVGNGRLGVRVGPLVLDWNGDSKLLHSEDGHDYWGRLNRHLLMTVTKHVYDGGEQLILPAWNQLRLTIGGIDYSEKAGRHHLSNTLDLRTGEVTCVDHWEYQSGKSVSIKMRLLVPRSRPCASWYEVSVSGLTEPATLRFGLNAAQVADEFSSTTFERTNNVILGTYTGRRQSRVFVQGIRWEAQGWEETGCNSVSGHAWITLAAQGESASLTVVHSVHGPTDHSEVHADLEALNAVGRDLVSRENLLIWKQIWAGGLHFQHPDRRWEQLVLTNQFHLLTSLDEDQRFPLGPLGISRPGWHGSQMWDADFWLFRAILPLWPKLARSIVGFRRAALEAAKTNAQENGLRGAFYPWLSNDQGHNMTSSHYKNEIHNNAWIGLAAWEAAGTPLDHDFLKTVSWPILQGVADFFVSRATRDADGTWHIRGVLPPDESVGEGHHTSTGACDDNVLTNVGARTVLRKAVQTAKILGHEASPEWADVADHLLILPAGPDGVIPEYAGYSGHKIKQADTILAFYPFQLEVTPEVFSSTQEYYHNKTDRGGPLMTTQIEALLTMQHGDRECGLEHLFTEYSRYVRGPHFIPFETPCNANSIMLTGIGGLLQALIFGWYGATLERPEAIPRIGDGW